MINFFDWGHRMYVDVADVDYGGRKEINFLDVDMGGKDYDDTSIAFIPYSPDDNILGEFYNFVTTPMTKSTYKTASAFLKQTRGDIEAAARLLSKHNFGI